MLGTLHHSEPDCPESVNVKRTVRFSLWSRGSMAPRPARDLPERPESILRQVLIQAACFPAERNLRLQSEVSFLADLMPAFQNVLPRLRSKVINDSVKVRTNIGKQQGRPAISFVITGRCIGVATAVGAVILSSSVTEVPHRICLKIVRPDACNAG